MVNLDKISEDRFYKYTSRGTRYTGVTIPLTCTVGYMPRVLATGQNSIPMGKPTSLQSSPGIGYLKSIVTGIPPNPQYTPMPMALCQQGSSNRSEHHTHGEAHLVAQLTGDSNSLSRNGVSPPFMLESCKHQHLVSL
ncbi:hypothetical protein J6590_077117 [Homalodisca vitripennis]|nr:hypothetical protein J6590_077117 [Homalodisca vitripennis]